MLDRREVQAVPGTGGQGSADESLGRRLTQAIGMSEGQLADVFHGLEQRLVQLTADTEARIEETLRHALEKAKLPRRNDLVDVSRRLDAIERRLRVRAGVPPGAEQPGRAQG